jgi:hypothetical protein
MESGDTLRQRIRKWMNSPPFNQKFVHYHDFNYDFEAYE